MSLTAAEVRVPAHPGAIGAETFARLMDRFAPFEARPRLAVAVSGGRDSMALALLAADWVRARGGELVAVTVDHDLRAGSAREAETVARWMRGAGIRHEILRARGLDPNRAVEASAREARYALLEAFCRTQSILHLLVGHHRADQRETIRMRAARGSGPVGRAGMAAVRETGAVRILRPFLDTPRAALTATLAVRGQAWIEDPSNRDDRFERTRLRHAGAAPITDIEDMRPARARIRHERDIARLAAAALRIHPAGFALVNRARVCAGPDRIGRDLLGRIVTCVGGGVYPPRGARLDNLWRAVSADDENVRRTLAGCVIASRGDHVLTVRREHAAVAGPVPAPDRKPDDRNLKWDNRFDVSIAADRPAGLRLDALGRASARHVKAVVSPRIRDLPGAVRWALPALFSGDDLVAGPEFGASAPCSVRFAPKTPVAGAIFGEFQG